MRGSPLFLRRLFTGLLVFALVFAAVGVLITIPSRASTPAVNVSNVVQLTSTAGAQQAPDAQNGYSQTACFVSSGAWVVVWGESATTLDYSFSTDGFSWSAKALLITFANPMQSVSGGFEYFATCSGITLAVGYQNSGGTLRPFYATFNMVTPSSPVVVTPETQTTGWTEGAGATKCIAGSYDTIGNLWIVAGDNANLGQVIKNGALQFSLTTAGSVDCGNIVQQIPTSNLPFIYWGKTYGAAGVTEQFGLATSGTTYVTKNQAGGGFGVITGSATGGSGECAVGDVCIVTAAGNAAAIASSTCFIESYDIFTGAITQFAPSGIPTTFCGRSSSAIGSYSSPLQGFMATDGNQNMWAIFGLNQPMTLMASNDAGTTWSFITFGNTFGVSNTAEPIGYLSEIQTVKGTLQAIAVESRAADGVYVQTFTLGAQTGTTGTQGIGQCPAKNTATFSLVNSTIFLYAGNALGQEVVNTIQVNVANVAGSLSRQFEIVVYVGTQQLISVNTPSTLAFQYTYTLNAGTKNQQIVTQVNLPLNTAAVAPLPFNWWAVGIIGDSHISLNQSGIGGLQTVTGSAPPANQPLSFTALNANVNKIALCATASFQSLLTTVSTTTQSASTTASFSTTITSTISTIGATLFTTASNWPVIFLILLLPAGLFLGVTKNIAGALLGLMIGTIIGTMMGILPGWAFIGIVIALAAIAFIARERG